MARQRGVDPRVGIVSDRGSWRQAMAGTGTGLDALTADLEANERCLLAHRAIAQLRFWRAVPSFEPS
jgi:hypothetical protein